MSPKRALECLFWSFRHLWARQFRFGPWIGRPPAAAPPHALYNLGNSHPNTVLELVAAIEKATGRTAERILAPPQPGDVTVTFADHSRATAAFGFAPKTGIEEGIARFVDWRTQR